MMLRFSTALFLTVAALSPVLAQEKAAFDPSKAEIAPLGLPSPYDKFLGLDQVLNLTYNDWKEVYGEIARDVDASGLTSDPDIALALGVKIADGVMSIKARHVQGLNDCSKQIEELAKKLGVKDDEMTRAKTVRAHANKGEWLQVFMELGFLQTDIMKSLRSSGNNQRRSLIISSGWIQGLHYTSYVISKHYSAQTSNFLREPVLVKQLQADLQALPASVKEAPKVAKIIDQMPAIYGGVNIALDGVVSKADVDKLLAASKEIVEKITSN